MQILQKLNLHYLQISMRSVAFTFEIYTKYRTCKRTLHTSIRDRLERERKRRGKGERERDTSDAKLSQREHLSTLRLVSFPRRLKLEHANTQAAASSEWSSVTLSPSKSRQYFWSALLCELYYIPIISLRRFKSDHKYNPRRHNRVTRF